MPNDHQARLTGLIEAPTGNRSPSILNPDRNIF
jgi:hypothetical protein